jgi:hypothetical protein
MFDMDEPWSKIDLSPELTHKLPSSKKPQSMPPKATDWALPMVRRRIDAAWGTIRIAFLPNMI